MNAGDEFALDHIIECASNNSAPWDLAASQVRRCAAMRRNFNSGKPTTREVEDFLSSREEAYKAKMAALGMAKLGHSAGFSFPPSRHR